MKFWICNYDDNAILLCSCRKYAIVWYRFAIPELVYHNAFGQKLEVTSIFHNLEKVTHTKKWQSSRRNSSRGRIPLFYQKENWFWLNCQKHVFSICRFFLVTLLNSCIKRNVNIEVKGLAEKPVVHPIITKWWVISASRKRFIIVCLLNISSLNQWCHLGSMLFNLHNTMNCISIH